MKPYRYYIVAYKVTDCHEACDDLTDVSSVEIPSSVFDGNRIWRGQEVASIFEDFVEDLEPDRPSENGTEEWNKNGPF